MLKKVTAVFVALMMLITVFLSNAKKDASALTQTTNAPEETKESKKEEKKENAELTIWIGPQIKGVKSADEPNATNKDFYLYVAKEYQKNNPNVKINVESVAPKERDQKLTVQLQGGNPPDIIVEATFVLLDRVYNGHAVQIDDIITEEDKKDIEPSILEASKVNGKTYFFPLYSAPCYMNINTDIFKDAGAEKYIPEGTIPSWTPDKFREALKAVSKKKDTYPFTLFANGANGDSWNMAYLMMFGAEFYNESRTEVTINSPEGVKALEFLVSLIKEGLVTPGPETISTTEEYNLFCTKKVAVSRGHLGDSKQIEAMKKKGEIKEPFNQKLVYFPSIKDPIMSTFVYGSMLLDTKDENRIKYSKDFVKFYSSNPYCIVSQQLFPVRQSIVNQIKEKDPMCEEILKSMKYSVDFSRNVPGYLQIRSVFFPEMQAAFTGKKTAKQALDDFAKKANEIIKENSAKAKN